MANDPTYYSFLICSHNEGKIVNVYYTGIPIAVITDGKLVVAQKKTLEGNLRDITIDDLPQPCKFDSIRHCILEIFQGLIGDELMNFPAQNAPSKDS